MHSEFVVATLKAGYNSNAVLKGVSFKAQSGRLTAILGRNGSGKSTLLKALCGIASTSSGTVHYGEQSLLGLSVYNRSRMMAYVPQNPPIPAFLTVEQAVAIAARAQQGLDCARANLQSDGALSVLGASHLLGRKCEALSGGEWRRVLIAQGMAQLPESGGILLLDEPEAFLDTPARAQVFARLQKLAYERSIVVLLSLHDLGIGLQYCSQAILIENGIVACEGSFEQVASAYKSGFDTDEQYEATA